MDTLDTDDFKILEVHWLASHLAELGLSGTVAQEYNLDKEDLRKLALIEAESRKISKANQGEPDG